LGKRTGIPGDRSRRQPARSNQSLLPKLLPDAKLRK